MALGAMVGPCSCRCGKTIARVDMLGPPDLTADPPDPDYPKIRPIWKHARPGHSGNRASTANLYRRDLVFTIDEPGGRFFTWGNIKDTDDRDGALRAYSYNTDADSGTAPSLLWKSADTVDGTSGPLTIFGAGIAAGAPEITTAGALVSGVTRAFDHGTDIIVSGDFVWYAGSMGIARYRLSDGERDTLIPYGDAYPNGGRAFSAGDGKITVWRRWIAEHADGPAEDWESFRTYGQGGTIHDSYNACDDHEGLIVNVWQEEPGGQIICITTEPNTVQSRWVSVDPGSLSTNWITDLQVAMPGDTVPLRTIRTGTIGGSGAGLMITREQATNSVGLGLSGLYTTVRSTVDGSVVLFSTSRNPTFKSDIYGWRETVAFAGDGWIIDRASRIEKWDLSDLSEIWRSDPIGQPTDPDWPRPFKRLIPSPDYSVAALHHVQFVPQYPDPHYQHPCISPIDLTDGSQVYAPWVDGTEDYERAPEWSDNFDVFREVSCAGWDSAGRLWVAGQHTNTGF